MFRLTIRFEWLRRLLTNWILAVWVFLMLNPLRLDGQVIIPRHC